MSLDRYHLIPDFHGEAHFVKTSEIPLDKGKEEWVKADEAEYLLRNAINEVKHLNVELDEAKSALHYISKNPDKEPELIASNCLDWLKRNGVSEDE